MLPLIVFPSTMNKLFILFFLLCLCASCRNNCEDSTEPSLYVYLVNNVKYSAIYGIGGKGNLPISEAIPADWFTSGKPTSAVLPIAINSDTSVYVFKDSIKNDTLAITYKRNIYFANGYCGFAVILNSLRMLKTSTFDSVTIVTNDNSNYIIPISANLYQITIYH